MIATPWKPEMGCGALEMGIVCTGGILLGLLTCPIPVFPSNLPTDDTQENRAHLWVSPLATICLWIWGFWGGSGRRHWGALLWFSHPFPGMLLGPVVYRWIEGRSDLRFTVIHELTDFMIRRSSLCSSPRQQIPGFQTGEGSQASRHISSHSSEMSAYPSWPSHEAPRSPAVG